MHRVAYAFALSLFVAAPSSAQPATQTAGFRAVDIFGGFATHIGYGTADRPNGPGGDRFNGWDVGASFRPLPWFGITGTIGRTWHGDTAVMHYLAGPRVGTSYGGNYYGVRLFAHVLAGVGSVSAPGLQTATGVEIAAGAGFDVWYVVRIQGEYRRLPHAATGSAGAVLKQNQVSVFLGGVIPLCFRGCRPNDVDGINMAK